MSDLDQMEFDRVTAGAEAWSEMTDDSWRWYERHRAEFRPGPVPVARVTPQKIGAKLEVQTILAQVDRDPSRCQPAGLFNSWSTEAYGANQIARAS
jgi:hypothetical protein